MNSKYIIFSRYELFVISLVIFSFSYRKVVNNNIDTALVAAEGWYMIFGFLSDLCVKEFARKNGCEIEYNRTEDKNNDNFSEQ